jgi:hypothetical protein
MSRHSSTHSAQIATSPPAISLATSRCFLPQKEHVGSIIGLTLRCQSFNAEGGKKDEKKSKIPIATRRPYAEPQWLLATLRRESISVRKRTVKVDEAAQSNHPRRASHLEHFLLRAKPAFMVR